VRLMVGIGVLSLFLVSLCPCLAQSPTGTISGQVLDPDGRAIAGAEILVVNDLTGLQYAGKSNEDGIYMVTDLPPGPYRIQVSKIGFKAIIKPDIVLNVQDALSVNFKLPVGAASIVVTVPGGAPIVNTENAAVSTVVDRQFADNLPLNGRSFQALIQLTPGVVLTASNFSDGGQFSVNGQRSASNYWMVDGVSANIGVAPGSATGNGLGGALGSFSVLGGTNSLVSVDALQEFRIQTSTYAPEFGRVPGAQISIVTRSGANLFHGTAFDYFRNDALDANNWFNGYTNNPPLPKAKERQNDFGGTFSGPIRKDKTFFFFSYEGLRLRLPQTALTTVPDLGARQSATLAMQPYLNAYPFDPKQPDLGNGIAQFNASFSDPASLDAYSLRVDHKLNSKLGFFGRYNYSPSSLAQRGASGVLSDVGVFSLTTQTATLGSTWTPSAAVTDDLRFNYSRTDTKDYAYLDNFGGAVPVTKLSFPDSLTTADAQLYLQVLPLQQGGLAVGQNGSSLQRQINVVDSLSIQKGSHTLQFGVDFRRLTPVYAPYALFADLAFGSISSFEHGNLLASLLTTSRGATFLFRDLGSYAQDTWRVKPRLTLTYGVRWDIEFVPQSLDGPAFPAVSGFNLTDLSELAVAQAGTPPYRTGYRNFAPRLGLADQLTDSQTWATVLRGGVGVFYDLQSSEFGNQLGVAYPYGARTITPGGNFPLDSSEGIPPITVPSVASPGNLFGFDPNLRQPYTLEWNIALEQALGQHQSVSISYVGALGRRLLQTAEALDPEPSLSMVQLVTNAGTSDYDSLQIQFQRRLFRGLQALASYSWSHSIDTASAGSTELASNALAALGNPNANRGPSDFDIRNAFSAGVTYDIPALKKSGFSNRILADWSLDNVIQGRTAPPVDVASNVYNGVFVESVNGYETDVRPNVVPGVSFYLYGSQYPGGKALNPAAFTAPPTDPVTGEFLQGNLGRNALRGFGAFQWDLAVHRNFTLHESLKLQFRAEMFNVLNHPNFGQPDGLLSDPTFGLSTQTLGQYLSGAAVGSGAFSPLYQIGGPRSVQLALKLTF
jgi:Carboxypeptidase regulatory-like domain